MKSNPIHVQKSGMQPIADKIRGSSSLSLSEDVDVQLNMIDRRVDRERVIYNQDKRSQLVSCYVSGKDGSERAC